MKKIIRSIIALLLTMAIVFTGVPVSTVSSQAAGRKSVPSIRNVHVVSDGVTIWGAPYVIYEVDGTLHDSRYMSQGFNSMAWNAMNKEDRRRVNIRYWQLSRRQEAFGDEFAKDMGKWTDDILGFTAVKEALDKKWEARYAGTLIDIYGDDRYQTVYDGIANFPDETPGYRIVTYYKNDPRAKNFMDRYNFTLDCMKWGKEYCYDAAKKAVLNIRAIGVRAISKELIGIIVSNFLTPTMTMAGPTKAVAQTTDLYTKLFDLFDSQTGVTGKIQEYYVGKAASLDDAVDALSKFDDLVTKRFVLADELYTKACEMKAELEKEAPELLEKLQNPHPEDAAKRELCEKEREERDKKIDNPSADVSDTSEDYTNNFQPLKVSQDKIKNLNERIDAELEKDKEDRDAKLLDSLKKQLESEQSNFAETKKKEEDELQKKMDEWADDMESAIDAAIRNAGFEIYRDNHFTQEELENYDLVNKNLLQRMSFASKLDNTDYYHYSGEYVFAEDPNKYEKSYLYYDRTIVPPKYFEIWESDLNKQDAYLKNKASMLRSLMDAIPGLFNSFYESYQPLAAKSKGYDAAIYEYSHTLYEEDIPQYIGLLYDNDSRAARCLSRINAIPNDETICDSYERSVTDRKENELAVAKERSAAYVEMLKDTAKEYGELKDNFDLAWAEYGKDLDKAKNIFNNQVPQYVKDLKANPYMPTDIDKDLKDLIDKQSNPKHFLKTEADKMTKAYDEFKNIQDELDINQQHMSVYLYRMKNIEEGLKFYYPDPANEYGGKEYCKDELFELFGVRAQVSFVSDDPYYDIEVSVSNGYDGIIITGNSEDEAKYGISPDQISAINRLPRLATDFYGGNEYHAIFLAAYTELKNRQGTILRQMKNGDYDLWDYYRKNMINAQLACEKYAYNSNYVGLDGGKTVDIYKETYDQDGIVATMHRIAMNYNPVTDINKNKNHNMNHYSALSDDIYVDGATPDITIKPGGSERLIVDVNPLDATDKDIVWSTANSEIAVVDQDGIVTGVSEGTVEIQAIAADAPSEITYSETNPELIDNYSIPDDFILTYTVTVDENAPEPSAVESITLEADKTALGEDDIATIEAIVTPDNASGYVSWSVSPTGIVNISADEEGEYGDTAEGWRIFVRDIAPGTATVTAKAENGVQSSIQISVKQKLLQVCDPEGNVEKSFEAFADAREWIADQYIEDTKREFVIRLTQDYVLDEEDMEYGVSALDYSKIEKYADVNIAGIVAFDLQGHTLTVKRSQYKVLILQSGTVMKNGKLEVLGPDGLNVYGAVTLDEVSAQRMQVGTAYDGDITVIGKANVVKDFIVEYKAACVANNVITAGNLTVSGESVFVADNLTVQGEAWLQDSSVTVINDNGVISGTVRLTHGEKAAYLAKYKDAEITINGNISPATGGMKLYVGVTDIKVSLTDIADGQKPAVKKLDAQTLLYKTTNKTAPKYVKVWQPEGSDSKYTNVVLSDGGVYASAEDEPIIEPDIPEVKPITKIILDTTTSSIGTGKSMTIQATALSADADLVSAPPISWNVNKKDVIQITGRDPENGTVTVKGVGAGTVILTATATDGSNKKASCTIKVGTSISKITIKQKKSISTVEAGKKLSLTAEISPAKPIVKTLVWKSDNPAVATVDAKGGVTGISAGTATISAVPANSLYDDTKETATYTVTVTAAENAVQIDNINFKNGVAPLAVGKSATLKAYTHNSSNNKDVALNKKSVVFYSSDPDVIYVTPTGKLTAKEEGEATITAVSLKNPSVKKDIKVTTYVAVKKIVLNATKDKVMKGSIGVVTVAQWNPAGATDKRVKWDVSGANKTKKVIEIAALPIGKRTSELKDSDFVTTSLETKAGERIAYRTLVATKKCVITATTKDGNKKAKFTVTSIGYVTSLKLKTNNKVKAEGDGYAATIKAGKSLKVTPIIAAEYGANKKLVWKSENKDVVTVDNGKIKVTNNAPNGSKVTVTASSSDGKCSVKLVVTVE